MKSVKNLYITLLLVLSLFSCSRQKEVIPKYIKVDEKSLTPGGGVCTFVPTNSWKNVSSGTSADLRFVQFLNMGSLGFACGTNGALLKTTNGGINWSTVSSGTTQSLYGISLIDSNTGWIVGNSGTIRKTTNGGTVWVAQTSPTSAHLRIVQFVDVNTGYIVGSGGTILKTTNGGTTWTQLNSGTTAFIQYLYFSDINNGWVVGDSGTVLKTNNGGASWTPVFIGTSLNLRTIRFVFSNVGTPYGYIGGQNGVLYKTTDGGATWIAQSSNTTAFLTRISPALCPGDVFTCGVNGNNTIIRGNVYNNTWITELITPNIYDMDIIYGGGNYYALIGVGNGGIIMRKQQ